jgi:hypothetical protein
MGDGASGPHGHGERDPVRVALIFVLGVFSVGVSGCSSNPSNLSPGKTPAGKPTTSTVRAAVANLDNGTSQQTPLPVSNTDNAVAGGRRVPPPRTVLLGTPPPLEFRKGAENSRTATTMNSDGQAVEVRIFKGHPKLARVEATWLGPKEKLVRITLRDGSTLEVRTDQLADLATATSEQLLKLAGAGK